MPFRSPTPVFHLTDVENLQAIIAAGALLCHRTLEERTQLYRDASDHGVQDRRGVTQVTAGPGGTLHDYVPLYFGKRSPMLYRIWKQTVEGYEGSQEDIVHLVAFAQEVASERRCVFTSGHAVMALSWPFRTDLADLAGLPWDRIDATFWFDDAERGYLDRERPKQAEFLVHNDLPWHLVRYIAVMTESTKQRVESILQHGALESKVVVRPDLYYEDEGGPS